MKIKKACILKILTGVLWIAGSYGNPHQMFQHRVAVTNRSKEGRERREWVGRAPSVTRALSVVTRVLSVTSVTRALSVTWAPSVTLILHPRLRWLAHWGEKSRPLNFNIWYWGSIFWAKSQYLNISISFLNISQHFFFLLQLSIIYTSTHAHGQNQVLYCSCLATIDLWRLYIAR